MEPTLIGLAISAIVPKLLELLKSERWAPFINHYSPWVNRTTAIAIAFLTALGVTVHFDAAAGVLTVAGLLPDHILRTGLTWLANFAVQESIYRLFINQPSRTPTDTRRGLLVVPILLALTFGSSACAKVGPELVAGEKTVRTTVLTVSNTIEPLVCNAEARKLLSDKPCLELLDALQPAVDFAMAYNRALREGNTPAIVETIQALDRLIAAVRRVVPDSTTKTAALQDLTVARVRAEGGK